jgi:hypothetical protein
MKQMQDFYNWLSSNKDASITRKSRLAALMSMSRDKLSAAAVFDPWYVWTESSPSMA